MRISIFGATGQVGSEFVKHFPSENLLLSDEKTIDVCIPDQIEKAFESKDFDVVVNLAAFHNTNGCEENQAQAYALNATGAYNVAKAAARYNRKVVFFSSDYVFGQNENRRTPYLEHDAVGPLNVYGASKVAGEMMVRALCPNHLIVRTSSLFGVTTSKKGWTFPEMIVNRARDRQQLKVVTDQIMSPTYTYDLIAALRELLDRDATGTVHLCNGGECSWHEFAVRTLDLLGIDYPISECTSDEFPSPSRRPAYSAMNSVRAEQFGVAPLRHWSEALAAYLKEKGFLS